MIEDDVTEIDIEALRNMIRTAPPGSVLAVSPNVYDRHRSTLLLEVAGTVGHRMTISRSPAMKPGMVAVLSPHAGTPFTSPGTLGKFLGKYGPGVSPPPPPPEPEPPPPPPPEWPAPGPRQRIVDT